MNNDMLIQAVFFGTTLLLLLLAVGFLMLVALMLGKLAFGAEDSRSLIACGYAAVALLLAGSVASFTALSLQMANRLSWVTWVRFARHDILQVGFFISAALLVVAAGYSMYRALARLADAVGFEF
jgi:uncharacterized membrane protein